MLSGSEDALVPAYDLVMFDLDGVVYVGGAAVAGAADHIARVRDSGAGVAFVTNNASRPPRLVADHLVELGIEAEVADVVTSAQAAARLLLERYGAGARVVALGGDGLIQALTDLDLEPLPVSATDAVAIVTGYGPEVLWRDIMRAAVLIRDGLPWVASNTDRTIPTPYGVAPGHGVLVATLRDFSGVEPLVAGKPARPLLDETIRRVGGQRPLMVGDRLDTDIEGARAVGIDSLLVLTGVTDLVTLLAARPEERPTYLHPTLEGLFEAQPAPQVTDGGAELGGWRGSVIDGTLTLEGEGSVPDWWRVAATVGWSHLDATGAPVSAADLRPPSATVGWSHLDATGAPVSAADLRPPSAEPGSPRDSLTA